MALSRYYLDIHFHDSLFDGGHPGMNNKSKTGQATLRSYVIGYILSIYLTLSAYFVVTNHLSVKWILIVIIVGLALIQFAVQLFFFMHMGNEAKPRFKFMVFGMMIAIVLILVFGSLWIMSNLNYRQMPSQQQVNNYLQSQSDGGI